MSETKGRIVGRKIEPSQVVMVVAYGLWSCVLTFALMSIWSALKQNRSDASHDGGNKAQNGGSFLSHISIGRRVAIWEIGSTNFDSDHWMLKCPYDQTTFNEYPATSCRSCGKSFKVEEFTCSKCTGGHNPCSSCDGMGYHMEKRSTNERITCPSCKGTQEEPCDRCNATGMITDRLGHRQCPQCWGTKNMRCHLCFWGIILKPAPDAKVTCSVCGGAGKQECSYCKGKSVYGAL